MINKEIIAFVELSTNRIDLDFSIANYGRASSVHSKGNSHRNVVFRAQCYSRRAEELMDV